MGLKLYLYSLSILLLSLVVFIYVRLPVNKLKKYHTNYGKKLQNLQGKEVYDFIIIGAGTAGSILANRLSEKNVSVLLLEVGGVDNDIRVKIPAAFNLNFETENDWAFNSIPQESKGNHTIYLPSGKILGGSSSINAMIYLRGSAHDYDEWENGEVEMDDESLEIDEDELISFMNEFFLINDHVPPAEMF